MKTAQKVAVGVLALAAIGGGAMLLLKRKKELPNQIAVQTGKPNITVKYQDVQLDLSHLNANTGTGTIFRYNGTVVI